MLNNKQNISICNNTAAYIILIFLKWIIITYVLVIVWTTHIYLCETRVMLEGSLYLLREVYCCSASGQHVWHIRHATVQWPGLPTSVKMWPLGSRFRLWCSNEEDDSTCFTSEGHSGQGSRRLHTFTGTKHV